jgi:glycosyltransferase involved in cell wall biosynthesis
MRILQLHVYGEVGGIEHFTRDTFAELEARGHQIVLLYGGAQLTGLGAPGRSVHFWPRAHDFGEVSDALNQKAQRIISQERPDVALVHTPINLPLATAILEALPTVYFAHNYGAFCPAGARLFQDTDTICQLQQVPNVRCLVNAFARQCNTRRPGPLWRLYRRAAHFGEWARQVEAVICDSVYVSERCVENGFSPERLFVLPSAVRLPADSLPGDPGANVVLFVGRLSPEKGVDYLIRAIPHISAPCTVVVAGAGKELPALIQLAERQGVRDRIRFLGKVEHPAVDALYAGARVSVVPSVWPEPFGMVGPEAMSHGVPVVAFRVGGIPEWLMDGQTGFLVEPRDVAGLARRIDQLLHDPALARRLGGRGRQVVEERFTLRRHVDALERVFADAIEKRAARVRETVG